jgi:hypothetical protein
VVYNNPGIHEKPQMKRQADHMNEITIMSDYLEVLREEHVKAMSFETLMVHLRTPDTIRKARDLLSRFADAPLNVRVVLAGFLVKHHKPRVFEDFGNLEQALVEATLPLLSGLEELARKITPKAGEVAAFNVQLRAYLAAFEAWKKPDEAKLLKRIEHALVALGHAESALPASEPEDSKLVVEFRSQTDRLRDKMLRIGGADCLAAFDERHPRRPRQGASGGSILDLRLTNEHLAHELLFDADFQLEESGGLPNQAFDRIREQFHAAFWASLVDDLRASPPIYSRVARVLGEVRDGLADLVCASYRIHEVVDVERITAAARAPGFAWAEQWGGCRALVDEIVFVIRKSQAPKRDAELDAAFVPVRAGMAAAAEGAMEHPVALCKALEFLLARVNLMRIDAANMRLRLIAPVVRDHGVDYERGKFQEKLDRGAITTERTAAWLRAAASGSTDVVKVHSLAMRALVTGETPVSPEMLPETLEFDLGRLVGLQAAFGRLVDQCTVLVTASHFVRVLGFVQDPKDLEARFADFTQRVLAMQEVRLVDAVEALRDVALVPDSIRPAFGDCLHRDHPVRRLLAARIRKVYEARSSAFLPTARAMLPAIQAEAAKLDTLTAFNCAIHLPTYARLLSPSD